VDLDAVRRDAGLAVQEVQKPTPRIVTAVDVVLKLVVAVNRASNCRRALATPGPKGLPAPTQFGAGISMIIVRPAESWMTRW